jgi:hypothetical protein
MNSQTYSMLFLKGAKNGNIEPSWPTILYDTYLFSKDVLTWFPLPRGLIEPVDRIFDRIIADLGTKYLGVRYLPNSAKPSISKLMRDAKHFISDDGGILTVSLRWKKPCIYFNRQMGRSVFISKDNNGQEIWAEELGFTPAEIIYYEHKYKYPGHGRLFRTIDPQKMSFYHASRKL